MKIFKKALIVLTSVVPTLSMNAAWAEENETGVSSEPNFILSPGQTVVVESKLRPGVKYIISHDEVVQNLEILGADCSGKEIGVNIHEEAGKINFSSFDGLSVVSSLSHIAAMPANAENDGGGSGGGL